MQKFISIIAILTMSFAAQADGDHSEDLCSVVDVTVCAHMGHMADITPTAAGSFVAHVELPATRQTTEMTVTLWMPSLSQGSSPVVINEFAPNKYHVTEAYFNTAGEWLVRLNFNLEGKNHEIDIPITVLEPEAPASPEADNKK